MHNLYLCEYCDHPPYHRESAYRRHMATHTEDNIKLFQRDLTYRQLRIKATRVAKAISAAWGTPYQQAYDACYDATIDLLLAGQATTYRHIRRDAYRLLWHEREVSLDSLLDDVGDEGLAMLARSWSAYDMPAAYLDTSERLMDAAGRLFAAPFNEPKMARWTLRLVGIDNFLVALDARLEHTQTVTKSAELSARLSAAGKRGGRPRKQPVTPEMG